MCYIMISKQIGVDRDLSAEEKIKKVALQKLETNADGFFIQGGAVSLRTMDKQAAIRTINAMPFTDAMMHFRFATVGKKNVSNVHGWEEGGFQFLHNGSVADYSPAREVGFNTHNKGLEQEDADSKLLFNDLRVQMLKEGHSDKKTIRAIKKVINSCSFWGRAALYNKVQDKMWLFGDWHVYLAENTYLIFSSADINIEQDYSYKTHGIKFLYSTKPLLEDTFDGIALIRNFSRPDFQFKYRCELEDPDFDMRPVVVSNTTEMTEEEEIEAYNQTYGYNFKKHTPAQYSEGEQYEEDVEFENIWDIPEYQNMNPFDMDVITNEEGTHDCYGICCEYDTCWIYESLDYKNYRDQQYKEAHEQELNFLNGLQAPKKDEEVILEV